MGAKARANDIKTSLMCFKMDAALCFFEGNFIYVECNLVFFERVRNDGQKKNLKKREQKKLWYKNIMTVHGKIVNLYILSINFKFHFLFWLFLMNEKENNQQNHRKASTNVCFFSLFGFFFACKRFPHLL